MKDKNLIYIILVITYIVGSILILIWNAKTGGTMKSYIPLLMLASSAVVCAILMILDFKKK
ncbi:MAG: hypothetical protein MRZ75_08175 [Roseburia sp.]|nr:hypothetical protein [Roseburia sp.]MDY5883593.1 hypothetical protein [Roseburia sp.]